MKTCNQCGNELKLEIEIETEELFFMSKNKDIRTVNLFVCENPECPNYSLLQIPTGLMSKEKVKK
jgi:hypothetical protein